MYTVLFVPKFATVASLPTLFWFRLDDFPIDHLRDVFPVDEVDTNGTGAWFTGFSDTKMVGDTGRSDIGVSPWGSYCALNLPPPLLDEFLEYLEALASSTVSRWVGVCHWEGATTVSYRRDPVRGRAALRELAVNQLPDDIIFRFELT